MGQTAGGLCNLQLTHCYWRRNSHREEQNLNLIEQLTQKGTSDRRERLIEICLQIVFPPRSRKNILKAFSFTLPLQNFLTPVVRVGNTCFISGPFPCTEEVSVLKGGVPVLVLSKSFSIKFRDGQASLIPYESRVLNKFNVDEPQALNRFNANSWGSLPYCMNNRSLFFGLYLGLGHGLIQNLSSGSPGFPIK